jgi:predicted phage-related endonuclease
VTAAEVAPGVSTPPDDLVTPTARVFPTGEPGTDEWVAARSRGIGGSDLSAIMGDNPHRTVLDVWLDKTRDPLAPPAEFRETEAMRLGTVLQEPVACEFLHRLESETGRRYGMWAPPMLQDIRCDYRLANPDYLLFADNLRGSGIPDELLEVKTAGYWAGTEWSGDGQIGAHALWQTHHYLLVTGLPRAFVVCLIGGQRLVWHEVFPDPELHEAIVTAEAEFWRHVIDRDPPPVDGSAAATSLVRRLYPTAVPDSSVELDGADAILIDEYRTTGAAAKEAERAHVQAANRLRMRLGDAEAGILDGRVVVTNKTVPKPVFDRKRFAADHPDLDDAYTRDSSYRRLHVPARGA